MSSLFIALPYTRPDCRAFTKSLVRELGQLKATDITMHDVYPYDPATARNHLVDVYFMDPEPADFFAFIDNDASWRPGSLQRLIDANVAVCCGGMYTIDIPPRPTVGIYMGKRKEDGKELYSWRHYTEAMIAYCKNMGITELDENEQLFGEGNVLMPVDGCGMHFTVIRRDVLEAMRGQPNFLMLGKTGAGEDFYFCRKVRELGFKIFADLSVQTGHWAGERRSFGLREMLAWARLNGMFADGWVLDSVDETEWVVKYDHG